MAEAGSCPELGLALAGRGMDAPVGERRRQPGAGGEGDGNIADQLEGKQPQLAAGDRLCPGEAS
eukprot:scaffold85063_cov65-Phaeocystis_antarctica.AAC.2